MVTIHSLEYFFPNLEPICYSMSGSNSCFLTCIQISQEAGQVVWYSHVFKIFSQELWSTQSNALAYSMKQKCMFFWNSLAFSMIQQMLVIRSLVPLSVGFPRQEYWSRLPFPSPGDFPKPWTEPASSALQVDPLPVEPLGKPNQTLYPLLRTALCFLKIPVSKL